MSMLIALLEIWLLQNQHEIQLSVIAGSVPICLKDKLREELDRTKRLHIIKGLPVSESSKWVN